MENRRRTHRSRTCLEGRVVFNHRQSTMDCIVRNLSANGARIALADYATLPDDFDITICRRRELYKATVIWRSATDIGLSFSRPAVDNVIPMDLTRTLRRLENERDALARRIADMTSPI